MTSNDSKYLIHSHLGSSSLRIKIKATCMIDSQFGSPLRANPAFDFWLALAIRSPTLTWQSGLKLGSSTTSCIPLLNRWHTKQCYTERSWEQVFQFIPILAQAWGPRKSRPSLLASPRMGWSVVDRGRSGLQGYFGGKVYPFLRLGYLECSLFVVLLLVV